MGAFEYRQAQEIRDTFTRHEVRYLFIGKSGAILLGFPDTTQDADLFVDRSIANCRATVAALRELGFELTDNQANDIIASKAAANRQRDRESLPRLRSFREYWLRHR